MGLLTQSEAIEALRKSYGGSDNTQPSFLRPQYVQHNSPHKARDFGMRDNLSAVISGVVGSETGAATLFFKVTCANPTDLRILQGRVNDRTDHYITVGICDGERRPLSLDEAGFARSNDIHNTDVNERLARQPAGTYYFTVSSTQWQSLPFAVALLVISYRELLGSSAGSGGLAGRLAMAKLNGAAGGANSNRATLARPSSIKTLGGNAGGSAPLGSALAIPRGVATGSLLLQGRLKQYHRLQAAAGGSLLPRGTLTVTSSGGGYGY